MSEYIYWRDWRPVNQFTDLDWVPLSSEETKSWAGASILPTKHILSPWHRIKHGVQNLIVISTLLILVLAQISYKELRYMFTGLKKTEVLGLQNLVSFVKGS